MASTIAVVSARPDGATCLAVGLAAAFSADARSLLIDLNLDRPELAALLELDERQNLYHLAYNAQLAPAGPEDLEEHVRWRDNLAVITGITHPMHRARISDLFVDGMLSTAQQKFEHVTVDLGRARGQIPTSLASGALLWCVTPSPLGLAAFDRCYRLLEEERCDWLDSVQVVVTRVADDSLAAADRFLEREYRVRVVASIPHCPGYWRQVEISHSLRALTVPLMDRGRYLRAYGPDALRTKESLLALAERLAAAQLARL